MAIDLPLVDLDALKPALVLFEAKQRAGVVEARCLQLVICNRARYGITGVRLSSCHADVRAVAWWFRPTTRPRTCRVACTRLTAAALSYPRRSLVVVLDASDDGSEGLAGRFGPDVHFVSVDAGNVGAARAAGFEYARAAARDVDRAHGWYATTDADSWSTRTGWCADSADADMVLGVVRVPVWRRFSPRWRAGTCTPISSGGPGHATCTGQHGFRADAYWRVGGLPSAAHRRGRRTGRAIRGRRLRIHRDAKLSVATSDRGAAARREASRTSARPERKAGAGT